MALYQFGIGGAWGIPNVANPTPVRFGTVKDVTVDMTSSEKDLNGQSQVPVAIGIGPMKIGGTIQQAEIDANRFATLFFTAPSLATGQVTAAMDEAQTVPTTPYQVTVANASFYVRDLGVLDQTTGVLLSRVASGPTTGQYSVNTGTGVYTFAAADTGRKLYISYDHSVAATGANFNPINPLMGIRPTFSLRLTNPYQSGVSDLTLPYCVMTGDKLNFKNEDFNIPNLSFRSFAGPDGTFMQWSASSAQTGSRY